jgi:hypothetical protein
MVYCRSCLGGAAESRPLHSIPDPEGETLASTPQLATEDILMAVNLQSTPVSAAGGEPFPISTPELSLSPLDGQTLPAYQSSKADDEGETELNFDSTSSDENMKGRVEVANEPSEGDMSDGAAAAESKSPEGTMSPQLSKFSPAGRISLEGTINQLISIRHVPRSMNPSGLTRGALKLNQNPHSIPQVHQPYNAQNKNKFTVKCWMGTKALEARLSTWRLS